MHPRGATSAATASAPAATVCASSNRLRQQQGYTSSQLAMRHLFSPPATWTRAALTRPLNAKPTLPTWAQSLRQGFLSQTASTLSPRRFMPSRVGFPTTHSERSPTCTRAVQHQPQPRLRQQQPSAPAATVCASSKATPAASLPCAICFHLQPPGRAPPSPGHSMPSQPSRPGHSPYGRVFCLKPRRRSAQEDSCPHAWVSPRPIQNVHLVRALVLA